VPDFGRMFLRLKYTEITQNKVTVLTSLYPPYTVCPRGNVPDFGRMFLRLKYTDITQNRVTVLTSLYPAYTGCPWGECSRLQENVS